VRENIFRHYEEGEDPVEAAEKGTNEVALAVMQQR
jgi:multidrug efflux pump subunit AcrB